MSRSPSSRCGGRPRGRYWLSGCHGRYVEVVVGVIGVGRANLGGRRRWR